MSYVDGAAAIEPGRAVRPAFDTHTAGSQVVAVSNEADGEWVFAGDNVYSYENLEPARRRDLRAHRHDDRQRHRLADLRRRHGLRRRPRDPPDHFVPREPDLGAVPLARIRRRADLAEISLAGGHGSLVEALA
jgi:N-acyl homoserine lactone hydrolase